VKFSTLLLAAAISLVPTAAFAAPVLDQQQAGLDTEFAVSPKNGPGYHWQQGITAGVTGQFTSVDLYFFYTGTVNFGINLGAPWQTDANSIEFTSVAVAGWNSYDLTSANPYTGGGLFLNGDLLIDNGNGYDMAFRTYMEPATARVPDGGNTAGLVVVSIVVGAALRRRKAR
jgi:hypothetical protein